MSGLYVNKSLSVWIIVHVVCIVYYKKKH